MNDTTPHPDKPGWERELLTKLAMESLEERRRARRWGLLFRAALFLYLILILVLTIDFSAYDLPWQEEDEKFSALIDLEGLIASSEPANADDVATALRAAFEDEGTAGIILRLNSPGGSPVQSGQIYDEIQRLREKYPDTPVYGVITEVCASGCYYVAAATDKIYADKASLVGSIGVRLDSFGFVEALEKLGIERRLLTAGENKGLYDPFLPVNEHEEQHLKKLLDGIHQQFIDAVREGRGDRLSADRPELFTGLVWNGSEAVELGLIDDLASPGGVARDIIEAEDIVVFTNEQTLLERLSERLGASLSGAIEQWVTGSVELR